MKDNNFDMSQHTYIADYSRYLKDLHAQRNVMDDAMEKYFLQEWDEEDTTRAKIKNIKLTKHPGPRNDLLGAIRLLIGTDPTFSVPVEKNSPDAKRKSEPIEQMATAIWRSAGEMRGDPVHYDVVISMLTFGEVHIAVTRTSDLVESAKGGTKAAQAKAEEIADMTPVMFDVWDPRTGYPDLGPLGLNAYYRESETLSGRILDDFGDQAKLVLKSDQDNRYKPVTQCQFWDNKVREVWLNGYDVPLVQEDIPEPGIPVIVQLGEGSRLFSKVEYWRQPFLYTLWKSGLWNRQNLMLTVFYTLVFGIGANPMYLYKTNTPGKKLQRDFSTPGGLITIDNNEDYGPAIKNVIDPSLLQGMEVADQLSMESTIYSQTLGEPLGKNAPFSMAALMHQSGRLPLIVPHRKASWAIAQAVKYGLMWVKAGGKKAKAGVGQYSAELKPSEIPDKLTIEANLEISLPQDKMNNAQIGLALTQGVNPITSVRWARENVVGIGQSDAMQKEIWDERASNLQAEEYFVDQMTAIEAKKQAMRQQKMAQQQGMAVPGEAMPEGNAPGMNPNIEQQASPVTGKGMMPRQPINPIEVARK